MLKKKERKGEEHEIGQRERETREKGRKDLIESTERYSERVEKKKLLSFFCCCYVQWCNKLDWLGVARSRSDVTRCA